MPAGSPGLSGDSGLRRAGRETGGWGDSSRRTHCRRQVAPLDYRADAVPGRSPLITRCVLAVTLRQTFRVVIAPSFSHRGVTSETFCTDQTGFTPDVSEILAPHNRSFLPLMIAAPSNQSRHFFFFFYSFSPGSRKTSGSCSYPPY